MKLIATDLRKYFLLRKYFNSSQHKFKIQIAIILLKNLYCDKKKKPARRNPITRNYIRKKNHEILLFDDRKISSMR